MKVQLFLVAVFKVNQSQKSYTVPKKIFKIKIYRV